MIKVLSGGYLDESWEPTTQQLRILQSPARRQLDIAANRFGKTTMGMQKVITCARGEFPYLDLPTMHIAGGYWVFCPSEANFWEVHYPMFEEWCPEDWLIRWDNKLLTATIRHVSGALSTIKWWTYEQKAKALVGKSLLGCWMDEPPPRAHYKETRARLVDKKGWMMITMTPVDGVGWWGPEIYEPAKAGKNSWDLHQCALASRDDQNPKEYYVGESLVEHLSREQIVDFASDFPDEDDLAIRIFGEVRSRKGLVYKEFQQATHVVDDFEVPREWDLWGAVDPGYQGFAMVFGAVSPNNELVIVQEYFSQGEALADRFREIERLARELRPTLSDWAYQYEDLVMDEAVQESERMHGNRADVTLIVYVDTEDPQAVLELNNASLLSVAEQRRAGEDLVIGLCFTPIEQGLKAVKAGIFRVQRLLHCHKDRKRLEQVDRPTPEGGEPRLYLFDSLHSEWMTGDWRHRRGRLEWELETYQWKEPARDSLVKLDEPDKNSADGAHMLDALRYLVMARTGPTQRSRVDRAIEDLLADTVPLNLDEEAVKAEKRVRQALWHQVKMGMDRQEVMR